MNSYSLGLYFFGGVSSLSEIKIVWSRCEQLFVQFNSIVLLPRMNNGVMDKLSHVMARLTLVI